MAGNEIFDSKQKHDNMNNEEFSYLRLEVYY